MGPTGKTAKSAVVPAGEPIACGIVPVPEVEAVLWLAWTPRGLSHALWEQAGAPRPSELVLELPEASVPEPYRGVLEKYFAGEAVDPASLPVDVTGTPFQRQVWDALRHIARGHVRSYAGVAADIGNPRAMRAVGMANACNPVAVVVPCHRVVEKDLHLGGYSAGLRIKRHLLALEGVDVAADQVRAGQLPLI